MRSPQKLYSSDELVSNCSTKVLSYITRSKTPTAASSICVTRRSFLPNPAERKSAVYCLPKDLGGMTAVTNHFNKGSRNRRFSRTKTGRRCTWSENFGSPAPKNNEQPSPLPQMSGWGSSRVAPVCSPTALSLALTVAWAACSSAIGIAFSTSGAI